MTLLGCVRPERSLPLQDHVAVDDDDIAYSSDDLESAKGGREELNSINGHSKLPKMQHVKRLGHQTKAKAKKALRLRETQANIEEDDASISKALEQNPAFAPEKALAGHQQNLSGKVKSTLGKVQDVGFAIINPKETVKHKATIKLATGEQPFLPQRADESLLDAHAALYDAQSRPSTIEEDSEDGEDIIKWQERINDLEEHRSSMKVAWTTSRFVHRVRVHRQVPIEYPTREELEEYDEHGNYVRFQWEKWFARLLLRLAGDPATRAIDNSDFGTFDRDLFAQHIERIITASGPLQEWFINLRKIYRWEDPKLSATWFIVFLLLWYLDCVITFGHVWVVFVTVKNRYRKGSLEALRESYERTVDRGTKAYKFSELISKHGQGDWLDPLVEQIGPSIELQARDVADFMEILKNFYDWKDVNKSACSIFYICSSILLGLLTTTQYCMRIFTFGCIIWFFLGRPVASHHPKYRHLVSPINYVFWDIPSNAEWSFRYLCDRAQRMRQTMIKQKFEQKLARNVSSTTHPPVNAKTIENTVFPNRDAFGDIDLFSFRSHYHGHVGHFIISTLGFCFVHSIAHKQLWHRKFVELDEIRKIKTSSSRHLGIDKDHFLEFSFTDGSTKTIEVPKKRDEVFNTVIGFSGLQWKQLQPKPGRYRHDEGGFEVGSE